MIDMHGNSPKSLRHDLLKQRAEFAARPEYAQTKERVIAGLNQFLVGDGKSLQTIALYWPIQDELDIRPTLTSWASAAVGRKMALPFARLDKHLDFYEWQDGDELRPSKHGVPEPIPENVFRPEISPDCILIPCVGWSSSTDNGKSHYWRLGYGGGYFDRTLAVLRKNNPKLICMGIGFDWQRLDDEEWSAQAHDEPLDMLLTETGLLR
jgi:5-formyltetrahydrofolate cyclo-ligase